MAQRPDRSTKLIYQKIYWDFLKKQVAPYIGLLVATIATFPIESIFLPRQYINAVTHLTKETRLPGLLEKYPHGKIQNFLQDVLQGGAKGTLFRIVAAWCVVVALYAVIETIYLGVAPKLIAHIRETVFSSLIERFGEEYEDVESGKVISRILSLTLTFQKNADWLVHDFIPTTLAVLTIYIYTWTQPGAKSMAMAMTVGLGVVGCMLYARGRRTIDLSAKREAQFHKMSANMSDSFNNLFEVYNQNKENDEKGANKEQLKVYEKLSADELAFTRDTNILTTVLTMFTFAAVLLIGYTSVKKGVKKGGLSGVLMGSFIIIFMYYVDWMLQLGHNMPDALRRLGIIQEAMPFLNNIFSGNKTQRVHNAGIERGQLVLKNVTFAYDEGNPVLYNANLEITAGEKVAIVGRSGSGKSTLVKLILQMQSLDAGHILIDDTDASTIDLNYLRKRVNYINQNTRLLHKSILENMQYGNNTPAPDIVKKLEAYDLQTVFAECEGDDTLAKLHSPAGVDGGMLSLGMQKVTILLRGILKKSAVIYMFDEPVAGLDPGTRENVKRMIEKECEGKTCIYITHLQEIKDFATKVYQLKELNQPFPNNQCFRKKPKERK